MKSHIAHVAPNLSSVFFIIVFVTTSRRVFTVINLGEKKKHVPTLYSVAVLYLLFVLRVRLFLISHVKYVNY